MIQKLDRSLSFNESLRLVHISNDSSNDVNLDLATILLSVWPEGENLNEGRIATSTYARGLVVEII